MPSVFWGFVWIFSYLQPQLSMLFYHIDERTDGKIWELTHYRNRCKYFKSVELQEESFMESPFLKTILKENLAYLQAQGL